ncbi:MAG: DUF5681 domain-containing protein [Sphingomonas sp.]|jgi:hypothetical protein
MKDENPPAIRENTGNRNPDGTFPKGVSGNPSGRPRGTMKDYLRRKFMEMTDEAKEEFLKGVSPEMQIKLAEGMPKQDVEQSGEVGLVIKQVKYGDNDTL